MINFAVLEGRMRRLKPEDGDWEEAMSEAVDIFYEALEQIATDHTLIADGSDRSRILELLDAFDDTFR